MVNRKERRSSEPNQPLHHTQRPIETGLQSRSFRTRNSVNALRVTFRNLDIANDPVSEPHNLIRG